MTGVSSTRQASEIPSAAVDNSQNPSGLSGEPKLRQSVIANGRPPEATIFRAASATAICPPTSGSKYR